MADSTITSRTVNGVEYPAVGTYAIDTSHTRLGFAVRHMAVSKVRGDFKDFSGTIEIAEDPVDSKVSVTIQAGSVDTHDENRDNHLRTNDFFDAENYPTITIKSTGLKRVTDTEWKLFTDLTIRGVTKPVEFDLEYLGEGPAMQEGKSVVAFSASAEIDRRDFGVSFNHSLLDGSVVVGNKVKIELEAEAGLAE